MSWFKKKSKDEVIDYARYINEFSIFQKDEDREKEYNSISNFYIHTKNYYKAKINTGEINIITEKLLLESRAGKYTSEKSKNNISILIGVACALVPIYFQGFSEISTKYKMIITFVSVVTVFYMIVKDLSKDIIRDKNKDVMYNICLKVIDDIEHEKKAEVELVNDEVAAATQEDVQDKHGSVQYNGNWNVEISTLSIIDTIESLYKVGKFIKDRIKKE